MEMARFQKMVLKNFDKGAPMPRLDPPSTATSNSTDMNQYLTFTVGSEEYGAEILRVQEVTGFTAITPIPNAPHHFRGVMNLRGTIIPVIDLRRRFGLPAVEPNRSNAIVVVTAGAKVMGLLVDAVTDVRTFAADDIAPSPDFSEPAQNGSVTGLAKTGEKVVLLLDLDEILADRSPALEACVN
jgi:purine-binding chemotaxis protein CheW